jgi:hypothetical protein
MHLAKRDNLHHLPKRARNVRLIFYISSLLSYRLYLIPASRAPLRRVFLDGKDILLAYANGKARVWNTGTCEFRRSTGLDAGEDMLSSGEWMEV